MDSQITSATRKARILLAPVKTITNIYRQIVPVYECSLCIEKKSARHYLRKHIPECCTGHLDMKDDERICRKCLSKWFAVQLNSVYVTKIGCPRCASLWPSGHVFRLLPSGDRKLYLQYLRRATKPYPGHMYHPPDAESLATMINQHHRLCPGCARPYEIMSPGCGYMICSSCHRGFYWKNTFTVMEAHLRHRANISASGYSKGEVTKTVHDYAQVFGSLGNIKK